MGVSRDRRASALLAKQTNLQKRGLNYYKDIASLPRTKGVKTGFGSDKVGNDGLTGAERARKVRQGKYKMIGATA